jgi:hypothetical protein
VSAIGRAGRNRLVDSLAIMATVGGAVLISRSAGVAAVWWMAPFLVAVLFSVRAATLGVHELGHLVAGRLVGWTWQVFKVGPLLVARDQGSSRVSFGRSRIRAVGQVVFTPPADALDTELRRVGMLVGGPAASAVLCWVAWQLWLAIESPLPRVVVGVTALYSAIVFVTTVLPLESSGNLSDGGSILLQLRQRSERRSRHASEVDV